MASVMLFPTIATHRRLPHLSKESKESKAQHDQKDLDLLTHDNHLHHHNLPLSSVDPSNKVLALPSEHSQLPIVSSNTTEKSLQQHAHNNTTIQTNGTLTITANPFPNTASTVEMTASGVTGDTKLTKDSLGDHIQEQNYAAGLQAHHQHHAQQQLHPLNGSHGSSSSGITPLGPLPPSGTSLSLHESKLIKTALYDAFGCLYHPVQHTHHQSSSSTFSSTVSTPHGGSRFPTAALRSGEGTPLSGISPRASPMLRPHMVASAPITPLELTSSADGHAGGYFGLHGSSSHSSGLGISGASPSRHLHHSIPHSTNRRTSSLHHEETHHDYQRHQHGHPIIDEETDSPKNLSRQRSIDFNLNPIEHPVLCSLHTLSLTHPHPPEHYHPHLGHDLGHDRIPIMPVTCCFDDATAQTFAGQKQCTNVVESTQPPIPLSLSQKQQQLQQQQQLQAQQLPLTPGELLSATTTSTNPNSGKSPFPMDRNGPDSIGVFDNQGLV